MTREEIFETVKSSMLEKLEDLDPSRVTSSAVFSDLNLASLDFVEVVAHCQRAFKVKVPRGELSKIGTVGALVDAFERALAAQ